MTTAFQDASGEIRLVGTIYVPGATVGDVFTVQADGSLAPAAGGGSQPVRLDVHLDAADVLALGDGFEFGPTPDAGQMVVPTVCIYRFNFGTVAYSTGRAGVLSTLANATEAGSSSAWMDFGALDITLGRSLVMVGVADTPLPESDTATLDGQRLCLFSTQTMTDGDATVDLTVWYVILDTPTTG